MPDAGACIGVGAVEQSEERVPFDALRHEVNAAPVVVVKGDERVVLRETPGLRVRKRVRPTGTAVEVAADREDRVADLLRAEPAPCEPPAVKPGSAAA